MAVLEKGTLFDPVLVTDLVNKVRGKSSLAKLAASEPILFNGQKEFTFTMDSEVAIVAEGGQKTHGGVSIEPVTTLPLKIEYGARVSDEFLYAADEKKIDILKAFNDGFARKAARGLDLMAFHGVNPRTMTASTVIGTNNFKDKVKNLVTYTSSDPDTNIESAVKLVQASDGAVTGLAMAPAFSSALAELKVNGVKQFPELAWGANPEKVNGLPVDINRTVSDTGKNKAIVGDFADFVKWGYAGDVRFEVIEYGDPDGTGKDLKQYNQAYLRAEMFIGWGIFDGEVFARIVDPETVTFTATPDGTAGSTSSTKIDLAFNVDIYGLKAEHITLTDDTGKATKGALTGSNKNWSLAITPTKSGNISLQIADIGGYDMPAAKTVAVIKV